MVNKENNGAVKIPNSVQVGLPCQPDMSCDLESVESESHAVTFTRTGSGSEDRYPLSLMKPGQSCGFLPVHHHSGREISESDVSFLRLERQSSSRGAAASSGTTATFARLAGTGLVSRLGAIVKNTCVEKN